MIFFGAYTYRYDKSQQLFLAQVFLPAFSSVIGYQSIVLTPWGGPYEPCRRKGSLQPAIRGVTTIC
jgi:hypothetical protein